MNIRIIKDKLEGFLSRFEFFRQREEGEEVGPVNTDERPIARFGLLTIAIAFGGFFLWAALAPLDEGVPGTGVVSVDSKRKTIQHLRGGIIDSINVREGVRVDEGAVLVKLNDTEVKAQLDIAEGQYAVMRAIEARLLAERDSLPTVTFPPDLLEAAKKHQRVSDAVQAQSQLFTARRLALQNEMGTMDEAVRGLGEQIRGLRSLENAKKTQLELISKELSSYRELANEGFVPRNKLYELERVVAELSGSRGGDLAQMARAEAAINEVKLRKLQRAQDFRKEVETQLSDVQREVNSLADKLTALKDEFERTEIKAPIAGFVVGMDVTTIGGVIRPGDRIMDIVPEGDVLVVEAQLPVNLINNIQVGQLATMHFQIVTSGGAMPAIEGKLVHVSADRLTDPKTGAPYYSARLEITKNGEAEMRKFKIIPQPGMQADVVVLTGERTVLKYLLQPLLSRLAFGMKEH